MIEADQTPTPTKFLRNCEEMGLFHELSKNPFEEAFKKAAEDGKSMDMQEVRSNYNKYLKYLSKLYVLPICL